MLHFYEIDSFGEVKSLGKAMKCQENCVCGIITK